MPDEIKRSARQKTASKLRLRATGSVRSIEPAWSINFGPESDVDAPIPGAGGATLRQLKDSGQIPNDCFETSDVDETPREG